MRTRTARLPLVDVFGRALRMALRVTRKTLSRGEDLLVGAVGRHGVTFSVDLRIYMWTKSNKHVYPQVSI